MFDFVFASFFLAMALAAGSNSLFLRLPFILPLPEGYNVSSAMQIPQQQA